MYQTERSPARGIAHHGRAQRESGEASQHHANIIPWPGQRPRRATSAHAISLERALDSFLLDAEARQLSPMTLRYYRQQLEPFLHHLQEQGVVHVDELTADQIRAYLVVLQERGLKANTVHAAARAVRAFSNFLVMEELIRISPMRKVRMPRLPQEIPPAFEQDDVRRLVAVCTTNRDEAIILFLVDSGCRASELMALNIGDVNTRSGEVMIRRGKGGKDRITYVGLRTRKILLRYYRERPEPQDDEALWLSFNTGQRLTDSGLRILLRRLGKDASVAHCHPHTFRRTFALWSLRSGMNIYALQRIMGHSDLQVLKRYLALVDDDLMQAHRQHGSVDNLFSN